MPWYILTYDEKSPLLMGPYNQELEADNKIDSLNLHGRSEKFDISTRDRAKASRIIKEKIASGQTSIMIPRFKHNKDNDKPKEYNY